MKRRELPYHENIIQDLRHRLNNKLGAFFPKYRCHWELHPLASLCIILLATATERTNCQTPTFDRRSFSLDFSSERQHSWRNACHALKELMWPRDWCWMKAFHSECGDNFSQFRNGRGSTLVTYPRTIDLRTESRFIQLGLDLCQANHLNPILHLLDICLLLIKSHHKLIKNHLVSSHSQWILSTVPLLQLMSDAKKCFCSLLYP